MSLSIDIKDWNSLLNKLTKKHLVYAPFAEQKFTDFKLIDNNPEEIVYNNAKTLTSLKHFLFLLKEKVTDTPSAGKIIVIGAKSCDLAALDLYDSVFLDEDYPDPFYRARRENMLIIGTDCYKLDKTCHCMTYNINPYPEKNCDLIANRISNRIIISGTSIKGEEFLEYIKKELNNIKEASGSENQKMKRQRDSISKKLKKMIRNIPDETKTAEWIKYSIDRKDNIWKKYASTCVSCGACVTGCPTCHCFLLIDLPNTKKIEKIRTQDACQYPGFEEVAAGVDPLEKHFIRFRNRYVCKYINRPQKYNHLACTGCGRCTDTCIGKIDKNEVIKALKK
ncbi:MAG: 4Fe-4S dicluster domain-containing protein [Spirochaetes bacterium]|nr:4Fe-4S dicluster domain-containing protein [Spirochaetota bacterium]